MNADANRRLENIVRFGTIKTINPSKPIPRVIVNLGDIETPEIRCLNIRSGDDATWDMPSANEECVVISPCGDIGPTSFVLYGFYNDDHPAPSDDLNKKIRMFIKIKLTARLVIQEIVLLYPVLSFFHLCMLHLRNMYNFLKALV